MLVEREAEPVAKQVGSLGTDFLCGWRSEHIQGVASGPQHLLSLA